ncbi:MAG: ATP-binding cassette domain-containing protein [Myxococcales bacterium]|nr:ATP-binding cassette domain-containing protein [Myxococcales bacterium]
MSGAPGRDVRLECRDLHLSLGRRPILADVSFRVEAGEVLGVLGPSGAGKSSLFKLLAGELPQHAGSVRLADRDVTPLPLWRRARLGLGYLPQTPSVLFELSVEQNLRTFAQVTGRSLDVQEWARRVGLTEQLRTPAQRLSGGERRRLELARALIAEPQVLLCDEPFSGVDPKSAELLARCLKQLADGGAAVVISDHRVREALELCQRALLLIDGRAELEVAASEFARHPLVRERYLG